MNNNEKISIETDIINGVKRVTTVYKNGTIVERYPELENKIANNEFNTEFIGCITIDKPKAYSPKEKVLKD